MGANLSRLDVVERFFSGTGCSYDRVAVICTCGFDRSWKKRIIAAIPTHSTRILDQACGTGILTLAIARAVPGCRVTGVELRDEYLAIAREKARTAGMTNVDFLLGRAEEVTVDECDCITSSYLAKYADIGLLIATAARMLRPGGVVIMHDFTYPENPLFRTVWHIYFGLLRTVGGRVWPEWRTVFHELPQFLRESTWVPDTLLALRERGFRDISSEALTFGAAAIITARKP